MSFKLNLFSDLEISPMEKSKRRISTFLNVKQNKLNNRNKNINITINEIKISIEERAR